MGAGLILPCGYGLVNPLPADFIPIAIPRRFLNPSLKIARTRVEARDLFSTIPNQTVVNMGVCVWSRV
jgi:hypothetical protein